MKLKPCSIVSGSLLLLLANACGTPLAGQGTGSAMDQTFAGQNACNPENHLRPFIIEWDATDMASFEQYAASDVVVVKYEGCNLTILDRCRVDAAPGKLGAYKPVEWTSGSLESIDIHNQSELSAKLPLGVATLGGRVSSGEKFHMEYYVAGTRTSTRPDVYADDLAKLPNCEGATHFVYNYNLGAFGLGSVQDFAASADASVYGFGASGNTSSSTSAEKKGGDLTTCKSDAIEEVQGCKAPIRLTLRPVAKGGNPDATSADTDESLNAAAALEVKVEMSEEAKQRLAAAELKLGSGDPEGCLIELDVYDQLNPKAQSTDPKSGKIAGLRAYCIMESGKCDVGRAALGKAIEATKPEFGPDQIDKLVQTEAAIHCKGDADDRTKLLGAKNTLTQGAFVKKLKPEECLEAAATLFALKDKVEPEDSDDPVASAANHLGFNAARCLAKAGACDKAWEVYGKYPDKTTPSDEATRRKVFDSSVPDCKGK